jgi:hypothetical protein
LTRKTHLWPEEPLEEDGQLTLAATIEAADQRRQRLWYRLPAAHRDAVAKNCDPFVVGSLFNVMGAGVDLHVHGEASPSLLSNLSEFMTAWECWRPQRYQAIAISADSEREHPPAATNEGVQGFSGGCDSAFTAWRHHTGSAGRQREKITAGIFVHGFDIPLADTAAFEGAAEKARRMLESIGTRFIPIATNYREPGGDWDDTFGAALVSCLMMLEGRFARGIIGSGHAYPHLAFPHGSNPVTDPMLSSASFRIVHDGAGFYKLDKMREFLAWPEAVRELRVCWRGRRLDRNCCRCGKCVWTMLAFRLLGVDRPECFERDISNAQLMRLIYPTRRELRSMERLIARAARHDPVPGWLPALRVSVLLSRAAWTLARIRPIKKIFAKLYEASYEG